MYADKRARTAHGPMRLEWEHGSAEVQSLGGMLGPVTFRLDGGRELDVMHVAPWAGMREATGLPGLMQRLRGEWPCVPFGRTDLPPDLAPGWRARTTDDGPAGGADDGWPHGYASNHHWSCVDARPDRIHLAIDYPDDAPVRRIERVIAADPHAAALDISLSVWSRRDATLPVGLHPTFRLPPSPGRVCLELGRHEGVFSYPSASAGAVSLLAPDVRSAGLSSMAGKDGPLDLGRLPLAGRSEDLMQVRAVQAGTGTGAGADTAPFALHYLDYDASVGLWWDTRQLPDLMLWVSNGGRPEFPWTGRHLALGAEPVNSLFDLGRVAQAPPGHPLADRTGVALSAAHPWHTRYRIAAWPRSGN